MPFTSVLSSLLAVGSTGSTGSTGGSSNGLLSFLPLLLIVVIGYLLLVRPARTRQRKAAEVRSAVQPGTEVTTTAGMIATVVAVDDDTVTLEVAPGVHSRYVRAAIARVNSPFEEPMAPEEAAPGAQTPVTPSVEPSGDPSDT